MADTVQIKQYMAVILLGESGAGDLPVGPGEM
jgi:hypothetical protein